MFNGNFLNSKERKEIASQLEEQFGCSFESDLFMLKNNKEKIFIVTRALDGVDLTHLRIDTMGSYVLAVQKDGLRPTIEGSELLGPKAIKNIVDIDDGEMREWLKGKDLPSSKEGNALVLIRHDTTWLGAGKLREGIILNFVPKNRRILASD